MVPTQEAYKLGLTLITLNEGDDVDDMTTRVTRLEAKSDYMEKKIEAMIDTLQLTHIAVTSIKERLDKWNGSIPHMAEDIKEQKADLKEVKEKMERVVVDYTEVKTKFLYVYAGLRIYFDNGSWRYC